MTATDALAYSVGLRSAARLISYKSRLLEGVAHVTDANLEVRRTVTAVRLNYTTGTDEFTTYDRFELECGHVFLMGNDDEQNASLVGAQTRCNACTAQLTEGV